MLGTIATYFFIGLAVGAVYGCYELYKQRQQQD